MPVSHIWPRELERLFLTGHQRIRRLVFQILHDREEAEDVAIEAFHRAAEKWSLLGKRDVEAWVVCIAQNLAKSRLRSKKRRPADALLEDVPAPSFVEGLLNRLEAGRLVRQLPDHYRAVAMVADRPEAEGAAALGMKLGSFKTRRFRMRQAARRLAAE
jgi:DNA-directed RNA polymerase specialized sigma24 family protein